MSIEVAGGDGMGLCIHPSLLSRRVTGGKGFQQPIRCWVSDAPRKYKAALCESGFGAAAPTMPEVAQHLSLQFLRSDWLEKLPVLSFVMSRSLFARTTSRSKTQEKHQAEIAPEPGSHVQS